MFTSSTVIKNLCHEYQIKTIQHHARNKYGLPFIKSLLQIMKKKINSKYYGYINSDILLNPRVLFLLPIIEKKYQQSILRTNFQIVSRVKEDIRQFISNNFTSIQEIQEIFTTSEGEIRNRFSLVINRYQLIIRMFLFFHHISRLIRFLVLLWVE